MKTQTKILIAAVAAAALLWGFFRVRKGVAARVASTVPSTSSGTDTETTTPADPVVVQYGDRNNDYVKQLQQWLNTAYNMRLSVDGIYGPHTDAALQKFHTLTGDDRLLTPDGEHFIITESQFDNLKTKFAQ